MVIQEYDKAERDFIKSLGINPGDAITWDNYGTLKSRQNNYWSAYEAYTKAIRLSPLNGQFINNVGWALLNVGKFEDCIQYFDKAISLDRRGLPIVA